MQLVLLACTGWACKVVPNCHYQFVKLVLACAACAVWVVSVEEVGALGCCCNEGLEGLKGTVYETYSMEQHIVRN